MVWYKWIDFYRYLREYIVVDVDNLAASENTTLRKVAEKLTFPLTKEDKDDILDLRWRLKSERGGMAGVAANQVGIDKRILVIEILPHVAKQCDCQQFEITPWVNPRYYKLTDKMEEGWEQCRSVPGYLGQVKRYKSIMYDGFLEDGRPFRGRADNFAARVIQHEIDHLNGKLFIDYIPREKLVSDDQYMKMFHSLRLPSYQTEFKSPAIVHDWDFDKDK